MSSISMRQGDYADGTAFFLYTPFEGRMLQDVLERLKGEAQKRGSLTSRTGRALAKFPIRTGWCVWVRMTTTRTDWLPSEAFAVSAEVANTRVAAG